MPRLNVVLTYRHKTRNALWLALFASLLMHAPVYKYLGWLAKQLEVERDKTEKPQAMTPPSEVSFEIDERAKPPKPAPTAEEKKLLAELMQKPPPPETMNQQAIHQNSQNPNVEPPPDAQYIAQENNRVQEETVARITNYTQHDDQVSAAQREKSNDTQNEGNSDKEDVADARDVKGSNERLPTPNEVQHPNPNEDSKLAKSERVREASSKEKEAQTIEVHDPFGTLRISSSKNANKPAKVLRDSLSLNYSDYTRMFGQEQADQERRAAVEARHSKSPGTTRARDWMAFRAALENYTPAVKRGNQTALNAAASPYANYLAMVHMRIHREFADRFLAGLGVGGPMNDETLNTKLEIVLNEDGTVYDVGIVRSSGVLTFDYGAFNAVMKGQPYPPAPKEILSGDARVYFHWGFYRNERQCGTFNAEPYILPNPPPRKPRRDWLHDNAAPAQPKKEEGIRVEPAPSGATLG